MEQYPHRPQCEQQQLSSTSSAAGRTSLKREASSSGDSHKAGVRKDGSASMENTHQLYGTPIRDSLALINGFSPIGSDGTAQAYAGMADSDEDEGGT